MIMKEMSLQEVQAFSFEILKDVHSFCLANGINYSLAYGTLIGAIRHKGFIPWDDDIDLIMPRPDYDRFCKEYKSDHYKIEIGGSPSSYIAFTRVYDDALTFVENTMMPWSTKKTGVWIDIFPIDSVSDNHEEFLKAGKKIQNIWIRTCHARNRTIPMATKSGLERIKTLVNCFRFPGDLRTLLDKHIALMNMIPYGSTIHYSQMGCPDFVLKRYMTEQMVNSGYIDLPFNGLTFKVIKEYDSFLRQSYGDYMSPPPIEKQVPKHQDSEVFYWK